MSSEANKFYSHGKLLVTGEYTVLHGASALALPLSLGQVMYVGKDYQKGRIAWKGRYKEDEFINAEFASGDLRILSADNQKMAERLQYILKALRKIVPGFAEEGGYNIQSELEFPLSWGLGSSSTLLANIAQWAGINPFELNSRISNGSGYDIACATSQQPVFYRVKNQKPDFKTIDFRPIFRDRLYFVYQGKKQSSDEQVKQYLSTFKPDKDLITKISNITEQIILTRSLDRFNALLQEHEALMSEHLGQSTLKQKQFPDFNGVIKSLGAWGGDFMMATCTRGEKVIKDYFAQKGLNIVFRWDEIIL